MVLFILLNEGDILKNFIEANMFHLAIVEGY